MPTPQQRTRIQALLSRSEPPDADSDPITVKGWVKTVRSSGAVSFVQINDGSTLADLRIVVDANCTAPPLITSPPATASAPYDALVAPVSPIVAFPLGDRTDDPVRMYLVDIYTLPVNIAGLPAMSIPCGFVTPADSKPAAGAAHPAPSGNRLPVGLQLIGPHLSEPTLLNIAHAYQQATDWHRQRPPI